MSNTNPVSSTIECVCAYFVNVPSSELANARRNAANFIRLHNEKLNVNGDISFPSNLDIWNSCYCMRADYKLRKNAFFMFNEHNKELAESTRKQFLAHASKWPFPVERLQVQSERCALFLQRELVIDRLLKQVLSESDGIVYGHMHKNPLRRVRVLAMAQSNEKQNDLSLYRAQLIEATLRRLLDYSEWTVIPKEEAIGERRQDVLQLQVQSVIKLGNQKSLNLIGHTNEVTIKCGIVTDPLTGKMAKLEASEYHNFRSMDMRLMAMHKYGIRVKDDERFSELMDRLGAAAVTVDLMEVRHSSPVQIIRSGQGSTKGASFILYNSARIESLLRTFDERVVSGTYGPLPDINDLDLTLLNEEEEWQLIFGYIFAFPNLIERCLDQLEHGACSAHLIVRFLSGFVSAFSVYYRRVRILTETRDHLMPYIYARMYLVKAVRTILNKTLALLNIQPVLFM